MKKKELQLVSFEQAKKLKELGFDWKLQIMYDVPSQALCYSTKLTNPFQIKDWNNTEGRCISAPTVALALKWFRDVKSIDCGVNFFDVVNPIYEGCYSISRTTKYPKEAKSHIYEEAESVLLDALILHCLEEVK
jgi:hypothetical protein